MTMLILFASMMMHLWAARSIKRALRELEFNYVPKSAAAWLAAGIALASLGGALLALCVVRILYS